MTETNTEELFSRGVASFIDPDNTFRDKVAKKLRGEYPNDIVIKLGIDPTRPDIHLGHAVILRKLRAFQDAGCKVIFLIGDYTSLIGDPTGKSKTRPELAQAEIEANMKTYLDQVGKILSTDAKVFSWIRNSDWFLSVTDVAAAPGSVVTINDVENKNHIKVEGNSFIGKSVLFDQSRMQSSVLGKTGALTFSFLNILSVLRHVTHARLIERDMFQDRLSGGGELYMHEMLYPVLQGMDSSALAHIYGSCDLEIGGTDQTFNMLMGRDVMRMNKQPEQSVMSMDILEGLDGKEKMSKSLDNYVSINDEPADMYGKVMSLPDAMISRWFSLATYTPLGEVAEIEKTLTASKTNPRDIKMRLAREIVAIYHGENAARGAETAWVETFSEKKIPENVLEITGEFATIIDAMMAAEAAPSKTEARRLVDAGAVTHLESDTKITDVAAKPESGTYRVGKMRFFKIK
jgi:tyrosyl-tRNA synthetase